MSKKITPSNFRVNPFNGAKNPRRLTETYKIEKLEFLGNSYGFVLNDKPIKSKDEIKFYSIFNSDKNKPDFQVMQFREDIADLDETKPNENQVSVDFSRGICIFNSKHKASKITVQYLGLGTNISDEVMEKLATLPSKEVFEKYAVDKNLNEDELKKFKSIGFIDGLENAVKIETGKILKRLEDKIENFKEELAPIGMIAGHFYREIDGWLRLDGSTHGRSIYPKLWKCIKAIKDGGGNAFKYSYNNFTLPDLKGRHLQGTETDVSGNIERWSTGNPGLYGSFGNTVSYYDGSMEDINQDYGENKYLTKRGKGWGSEWGDKRRSVYISGNVSFSGWDSKTNVDRMTVNWFIKHD